MINDKKQERPIFDALEFKQRVIDYLKTRENNYVCMNSLQYNGARKYYDITKEQEKESMKIIIDLIYDKKLPIYHVSPYYHESKKNLYTEKYNEYDIYIYYYKKVFDISMEGSIIQFNHPERGHATYDLKFGNYYVNGSRKNSLMQYFKGYSIGDAGSDRKNWMDNRIVMFGDLKNSGNDFLDYVQQRIFFHQHNLIKHRYRNLGSLLSYFSKFENMYNWMKIGTPISCVTDIPPSKIPKEYREILIKNKCHLTSSMLDIAKEDIEYFKQSIQLLQLEQIPNQIIDGRHSWNLLLASGKLLRLIKVENYNLKATLRYIFNYILPYEGMSIDKCLGQLHDYASMHRQMSVESFKKYPKFLKSKHDIIKGEFTDFKVKYDEDKFKKIINQDLYFEHQKFFVEIPECTEDIKYEGKKLSHCVGSYIKRIINGETQILFLREKKGVPQITLEVRDNVLIQARGYDDRSVTKDEKKYIKQYASEKKLLVRV